jgi:hypothetical protein
MKDLVFIFIVILVLLTMISVLGGSIHSTENFGRVRAPTEMFSEYKYKPLKPFKQTHEHMTEYMPQEIHETHDSHETYDAGETHNVPMPHELHDTGVLTADVPPIMSETHDIHESQEYETYQSKPIMLPGAPDYRTQKYLPYEEGLSGDIEGFSDGQYASWK